MTTRIVGRPERQVERTWSGVWYDPGTPEVALSKPEILKFELPRSPSPAPVPGEVCRVGAAQARLRVRHDTFMAGYSRIGHRAHGTSRPLHARALVLEDANGQRAALVFCDLWAPSRVLLHAVARRTVDVGIGFDRLLLVGTHTHTGPGHFFGTSLYDAFAQKEAGFDPRIAADLAHDVALSVTRAAERLEPGRVVVVSEALWDVASNRSLPAFKATREADTWHQAGNPGESAPSVLRDEAKAIDPRVVTLLATDTGGRLRAAFATFGCHANALGMSHDELDPDWPGYAVGFARDALKAAPDVVIAVAASAAGDATPLRAESLGSSQTLGTYRASKVGSAVAGVVASLAERHAKDAQPFTVRVRYGEWRPGTDVGGEEALPRWIYGKPALAGSEEGRAPILPALPAYQEGNPREPEGEHGPKRPVDGFDEVILGMDITQVDPADALPLLSLEVAGHRYLGLPGEPTTALAARMVRELNLAPCTVLHCASEYCGYFTTPEEYALQHYEGASTAFGPRTYAHLAESVRALVEGATPVPTGPVVIETLLRHGVAPPGDGWPEEVGEEALEAVVAPPRAVGPSVVVAEGQIVVLFHTRGAMGPPVVPDVTLRDASGAILPVGEASARQDAVEGVADLTRWTVRIATPDPSAVRGVLLAPTERCEGFSVRLEPEPEPASEEAVVAPDEEAPAPLGILTLGDLERLEARLASDPEAVVETLGLAVDGEVDPATVAEGIRAARAHLTGEEESLEGLFSPASAEDLRRAVEAGFTFRGMDLDKVGIDVESVRFETVRDVANWILHSGAGAIRQELGALPGFRSPADAASRFRYPVKAPDGATSHRLALFADFGTGLSHSRYIARQMLAERPHVALHLGDVYYAGTESEVRTYLEAPLAPLVEAAEVFALPGNHEMYSGGEPWLAWLDRLRTAPGSRQRQEGSSFCLEGEHHVVVGADTDWLGHARLDAKLRKWVRRCLEDARAAGKTTVLLTSNEPYDIDKARPRALRDDLAHEIAEGLIDLWCWGNVHYAALYDSTEDLPFVGMCLGHGGYPYTRRADKPARPCPAPVRWLETAARFPSWTGLRQDRGNNGFVVADLAPGGAIDLAFVDWMGNRRLEARVERGNQARATIRSILPFDMPGKP